METNRPNILLIMTDQQRPDEFGCLGTIVETPNLDQLISRSVRFSRAPGFTWANVAGWSFATR